MIILTPSFIVSVTFQFDIAKKDVHSGDENKKKFREGGQTNKSDAEVAEEEKYG